MNSLKLISDYKNNIVYRDSFNDLAKQVFGLDFQPWYKRGYWNDLYICHSFLVKEKIVANVSTTRMNLVIDGKDVSAIQIGTVMTDPTYRKKGLSTALLDHVLKKFAKEDLIFLFANRSVLDFYPKFGLVELPEYEYTYELDRPSGCTPRYITKLDPLQDNEHLSIIFDIYSKKVCRPQLDAKDTEGLLAFYCLLVFHDAVYYIKELNVILIFKIENNVLQLYEVISEKQLLFEQLIAFIPGTFNEISFYFIPDFDDINVCIKPKIKGIDDVLFVKMNRSLFPNEILFPITTHA